MDVAALALLFFLLNSHAAETARPVPSLNQTTKNCPACEWQNKVKEGPIRDAAKACAREVCKNATEAIPNLSTEEKKVEALRNRSDLTDEFHRKFGDQIRKLWNTQKERLNILYKNYESALEGRGQVSEKEKQLLALDISRAASSDFRFDSTGRATGSRFKNERPDVVGEPNIVTRSLNEATEKLLLDLLTAGMRSGTRAVALRENTTSLERSVLGLAPGPELAKKIKWAAQDILRTEKSLEPTGFKATELVPQFDAQLVLDIAKGREISSTQVARVVGIWRELKMSAAVVQDPTAKKHLLNFTNAIFTEPSLRSAVKAELRRKAEDLKADYREENIGRQITKCASAYTVKVGQAFTDNEKAGADAMIREVKKNVEERVVRKFSNHSQNALRAALNNVTFEYPPTRSEMDSRFAQQVSQFKSHSSIAINMDDSNIWASFCDEESSVARAIGDQTMNIGGTVQLGWESIRFPKFGSQVIAHEIGHQLSNAFQRGKLSSASSAKYRSAKTCLAQMHRHEGEIRKSRQPSQPEEGHYCEEDWSDLVAGMANPDVPGKWCTVHLDDDRPDRFDLINQEHNDTHSSVFFRLLHGEAAAKGSLPDSCIKALQAAGLENPFTRCLQ